MQTLYFNSLVAAPDSAVDRMIRLLTVARVSVIQVYSVFGLVHAVVKRAAASKRTVNCH